MTLPPSAAALLGRRQVGRLAELASRSEISRVIDSRICVAMLGCQSFSGNQSTRIAPTSLIGSAESTRT